MKPSEQEELVHRWVDGDLDPAEETRIEGLLANDPHLRDEADSLNSLRESLRSEFPAEQEPPYPDFFNSQIQRLIVEDEQTTTAPTQSPAETKSAFSWFALPWGIAAAALAGVAFMGLSRPSADGTGSLASAAAVGATVVSTTYTPMIGVTADTFFSDEADATVIRLAGLATLPSSIEIEGYAAASYQPDLGGAAQLRCIDGEILYVLLEDSQGTPRFLAQ